MLKREIENLNYKFLPQVVLIEDHASGQSVIQDLRSSGMINLKGIRSVKDKVSRFLSVLPLFQMGNVLFCLFMSFYKAYCYS